MRPIQTILLPPLLLAASLAAATPAPVPGGANPDTPKSTAGSPAVGATGPEGQHCSFRQYATSPLQTWELFAHLAGDGSCGTVERAVTAVCPHSQWRCARPFATYPGWTITFASRGCGAEAVARAVVGADDKAAGLECHGSQPSGW